MASTVTLAGVIAALLVAGCSKSAPPPGKSVGVEQVCSEPDGSRVRLTGYVRYRRGLMSFCSSIPNADPSAPKQCFVTLEWAGPA
jgi:hypothetical protein